MGRGLALWVVCLVATAAAPASGLALRPGDVLVSDSRKDVVFRIDPATGDRTIVTGGERGTGPGFQFPLGMALPGDGTILVADQNLRAILSVDPATGDRREYSALGVGRGRKLASPRSVGFGNGFAFVVDSGLNLVLRVDAEGNRQAFPSDGDAGEPLNNPMELTFDAGGTLYLVDNNRNTVVRVDPLTGIRDAIAAPDDGLAVPLREPLAIAAEADGRLVVADRALQRIVRVDPISRQREVVSANDRGTGPRIGKLFGIAVAADGSILVADLERNAVVRVDPATGDRVDLSSVDAGSGPVFGRIRRVIVVPGDAETAWGATPVAIALACVALAVGVIVLAARRRPVAGK